MVDHDETTKATALRQCYLFAEAADESLTPLAAASQVQNHKAGTTIFSANDEADGMRIILDGQVRVWLADRDGRELTLGFMEPGDTFGEVAILDGLPRSANATATEDTTCLFLPSHAVETAMNTDIALSRCLIHSLCELLRRNLGTITSFAFIDLKGRLANLLYELALAYGDIQDGRATILRRFSQTELALLLGVSREAVNKRLKIMLDDGFVEMNNGVITIPSMDQLYDLAEQA